MILRTKNPAEEVVLQTPPEETWVDACIVQMVTVTETCHCTKEVRRDVLLHDALQVFIVRRPQCPVEYGCQGNGVLTVVPDHGGVPRKALD
jgi:hypothetical protein